MLSFLPELPFSGAWLPHSSPCYTRVATPWTAGSPGRPLSPAVRAAAQGSSIS